MVVDFIKCVGKKAPPTGFLSSRSRTVQIVFTFANTLVLSNNPRVIRLAHERMADYRDEYTAAIGGGTGGITPG